MTIKSISYDVIIPTYKPDDGTHRLLSRLALQHLPIGHIIIINSDEACWKREWESEFPKLEVRHIKKEEFDHGGTRNMAAAMSGADILIFMTQDALPADETTLENLVRPIIGGEAEISYCRQVAKNDADLIEKFTREFNYPPKSRIKSKADYPELGIKAFFCTNVCCAYKKSVFDELGGFPEPAVLNEDAIFAARALNAGYRLSYTADAEVIHSHSFSGLQQYRRNYAIGASHAAHPEIFAAYPATGEGKRLVKETMRYVIKCGKPWLVFKVIWISGWKYLGYQRGRRSVK